MIVLCARSRSHAVHFSRCVRVISDKPEIEMSMTAAQAALIASSKCSLMFDV